MPRPTTATIHIGAMRHNLAVARSLVSSKIWAVVKADAYGHGLERALRGLNDADGMALVELNAAVKLRELGWQKPILLLQGIFDASDIEVLISHQLHLVVHNTEQIQMLAHAPGGANINVYLKMNSGMNRLGFQQNQIAAAFKRLSALPSIGGITLMTHFANSFVVGELTKPGISVAQQMLRFSESTKELDCIRSCADSASILKPSESECAWVRPGTMLYGATMFSDRKASEFDLRAAMTLQSEIIGIQHITAGEYVGYGSRFVSQEPMTLGVVACGYTDGYPRSACDGAPVLVDGVRTGVVGRVSMDSVVVNLTPVPGAHVGSKVTLWGKGLPIEEVAVAAETIGCELMCGLNPRVQMFEDE